MDFGLDKKTFITQCGIWHKKASYESSGRDWSGLVSFLTSAKGDGISSHRRENPRKARLKS